MHTVQVNVAVMLSFYEVRHMVQFSAEMADVLTGDFRGFGRSVQRKAGINPKQLPSKSFTSNFYDSF
jgi:hypothetical protein